MIRLTLAIILLLAAGSIFFWLTDPLIRNPVVLGADGRVTAGGILALQDKRDQLNQALVNAEAMEERLNNLQAEMRAISQTDINRLDTFIPTETDPVAILVDLNEVAKGVGLNLRQTRVTKAEALTDLPGNIYEVHLTGSVTATYRQLELFLNRLAGRRRPFDVVSLDFTVETDDNDRPINLYQVNFTVRTYQLR